MLARLLCLPLVLFSLSLAAFPAPASLPPASSVQDPDALAATTAVSSPTCFGEANGSIKITVTGGVTPYRGDVDANGKATFENLTAGSYAYQVYDAGDVLLTVTVELAQPDTLRLAASTLTGQTPEALGTLNIVPTGGTAPYVYTWSNGAVADTLSSLSAGTYTVTVTDAHGCGAQESYLIKDLIPAPTGSYVLLNEVTCAGDSNATIHLIAEGGVGPYHGDINAQGDTTMQNMAGGDHFFDVYDSRDSLVVVNAFVYEPDSLKMDVLTLFGERVGTKGKIKVSATGGVKPYTYDWGNISLAGDLIADLDNGTYHLLLTDDNGCTLQDSFVVEDLTATHFLSTAEVSIYPTLVTDHVRVDLQDQARIRRITVLGASGQLVSRRPYADLPRVTVEAAQLPRTPGTYVLWIETADGRAHAQRFVSSGQR